MQTEELAIDIDQGTHFIDHRLYLKRGHDGTMWLLCDLDLKGIAFVSLCYNAYSRESFCNLLNVRCSQAHNYVSADIHIC